MISSSFTEFAAESLKPDSDFLFEEDYYDEDYFDDAAAIVFGPKFYRPFSEGLSLFLSKTGYSGNLSDKESQADYLISRLKEIDSTIDPETVRSWFRGIHRPKIEQSSRRHMYEICFALHASREHAVWFFHHVYFDRAFNCHSIEEATFYFALSNRLSWADALELIRQIEAAPDPDDVPDSSGVYTITIQKSIEGISKREEFLSYMKRLKTSFGSWNLTACQNIQILFEELTGSATCTPADMDKLKRYLRRVQASPDSYRGRLTADLFDRKGLLLRIIYYQATENTERVGDIATNILEKISSASVFSTTFVLRQMLANSAGLSKTADIPYEIRTNFPSKKSLSDILGRYVSGPNAGMTKGEYLKSYDSIRKILILFFFFTFWCKELLGDYQDFDLASENMSEIFIHEMNALLLECGYNELFPGNPYDRIFMYSCYQDAPLDSFSSLMDDLYGEL